MHFRMKHLFILAAVIAAASAQAKDKVLDEAENLVKKLSEASTLDKK